MSDEKVDAWMPLWIGADGKRKTWAVVDPVHAELNNIPRVPGVYAIYFDAELVYIGQSNDLGARLIRHQIKFGYARNIQTPWGSVPDSVKVIAKIKRSRRLGDWAMWEIRLIRRLQPRFNRTMLKARVA